MKTFYRITIFLLCVMLLSVFASVSQAGEVLVLTLNDKTINPVTAEYIIDGIDRAEKQRAQCLIIELDTPGGLLNSTRSIVKRMLTSTVPVVVFISPGGSRAGSAGVFITYASHIAAMAPSTNIGAAHPVQMGGSRPSPQEAGDWEKIMELLKDLRQEKMKNHKPADSLMEANPTNESPLSNEPSAENSSALGDKILNDTVAFIRAIARERGRDEAWAVLSVVKSESITQEEALEKGVVEIVARDLPDLLEQLAGREVKVGEEVITLKTRNVRVSHVAMDARQKFFNILADPNIAYFLLILGFYGLLFEVTHPGIGTPGILGVIFLIIAFYSLQTLPTNYAGLALMGLGLILLIAEIYVPGFGLLTLGGLVCLALGSLLLFESTDPIMRVSLWVIGSLTASFGGVMIFLLGFLLKSRKRQAMGGQEGMIGLAGIVQTPIVKGRTGQVFVHGERWQATAADEISTGETVVIESVSGLKLKVKRIH